MAKNTNLMIIGLDSPLYPADERLANLFSSLITKYLILKEINMILVRFVFQAKFGKAGEVAEEFAKNTEMMSKMVGSNVHGRILTDLSGPFDTIVQELEVESLAEWEKLRAAMFANDEFQEAQSAVTESPFESGRTEFYTIESTF